MAEDKWNVKGLRGSVLEELINYTKKKKKNPPAKTCASAKNTDIDQTSKVR